ncbi:MAG: S8 family serine peptidase, partial [Gloeomargarita sp. SKYB31]|nr:S8 family serine peptidase [Gloeomargarita sp. SKYB31]
AGGYDFVENDEIPQDSNGHGTHIAGIIGALTNNSLGVAGVAHGASLYIYRVLGTDGTGQVSNVVQAIYRAISDTVHIINLSAGMTSDSQALRDAIAAARQAGIVTICAAGNTASSANFYPAVHCDFAVAATDMYDRKTDFSAYGFWWVDIAAPGYAILSTMPISATWMITRSAYYQNYDALSGTSMSAPIVSGVVALARQAGRCSSPESCYNVICSTADRVAGTGTFWSCGRVNAVAALLSQPQPTPTPWLPTPTPTPAWPATPTPLPTPTPTPFVYPTPAVLQPWGITMSLPVLITDTIDPNGHPVVGYSSAFLVSKASVDDVLGSVVDALERANSILEDVEGYIGNSALGTEALGIISGSVSLQTDEIRGQSVELLRSAGEEAMYTQAEMLASLAVEPPTLQEAAALIGIAAAQPIAHLRGWGDWLVVAASENPHGQLFTFIAAMIGLILLFLVLFTGIAIIRYIAMPIANALWNLIRDLWEAIPLLG